MRIGFIVHRDVPNINYRAIGPAAALKRAGHDVEIAFVQPDLRVDIERLRPCDAVHVYRLTNKETMRYLDDLRERGVALTWDNDDDIRLVPKGARRYTRYSELHAESDFANQAKVFRRIDLVTTTTPILADRFAAVGARAVVAIPNFPQPVQYAAPAPTRGSITIGWVAALEHYVDAETLGITDALRRILERHPQTRVISVGVKLGLPSDRYEHHRVVDMPQLHQTLRQFDIGIAPIADFAMNHARSDIKIKEYAAAGVPWLASNRGPYVDFGARQGGALVEDGSWETVLDKAVRSRLHRSLMRRRAIKWGKSQCIDRHVHRWVEAFEQALAIAEQRRRSGPPAQAKNARGSSPAAADRRCQAARDSQSPPDKF